MDINVKTFPNEVWVQGIKGRPVILEASNGERLAVQENEPGSRWLYEISEALQKIGHRQVGKWIRARINRELGIAVMRQSIKRWYPKGEDATPESETVKRLKRLLRDAATITVRQREELDKQREHFTKSGSPHIIIRDGVVEVAGHTLISSIPRDAVEEAKWELRRVIREELEKWKIEHSEEITPKAQGNKELATLRMELVPYFFERLEKLGVPNPERTKTLNEQGYSLLLEFTVINNFKDADFILAEVERIQKNCGKDSVRVAQKGDKIKGNYAVFTRS